MSARIRLNDWQIGALITLGIFVAGFMAGVVTMVLL